MDVEQDQLVAGRYRLGAVLGHGGMAEVYEGFDERLHRDVAVKLLRPAMAAQPDVVRRFEHEARSAARLSHPNVVTVFDSGEDGDLPYLVMERLPGETLADRIAAAGAGGLDPEWVRRVAGDVLLALAAAHDAGIVHRDIKPGNILIGADGCAKVADFGIAKSLEVDGDVTSTNQLIGTPAYLAPERIDGERATASSDLYSLGVVLYEALTGAKPFAGNTPVAMAYSIRHTRPPALSRARPDLPAALTAAIDRAMATEPAHRFPDARSMLAALDGEHTEVRLFAARTRRPPVRWLSALVLAISALVVAAVLAAWGGDAKTEAPTQKDKMLDVAASLSSKDGPRAGDAASRLRQLATSTTDEGATSVLADVTAWHESGDLSARAYEAITEVLLENGASPSALTTTTTSTSTTSTTAARAVENERKGKGKKDDD